MQGACVYRSTNNIPTLLMYKELFTHPGKVLLIIYRYKKIVKLYITTRELSRLIPLNSIDILTRLPYYEDIYTMIDEWCRLVKNRLNHLMIESNTIK